MFIDILTGNRKSEATETQKEEKGESEPEWTGGHRARRKRCVVLVLQKDDSDQPCQLRLSWSKYRYFEQVPE